MRRMQKYRGVDGRAPLEGVGVRVLVVGYVLLMLMAGGCMVGPDYQPPEAPQTATEIFVGEAPEVETLAEWWQIFHDSVLTDLIARGIAAAPTVEAARERLRAARAQREQTEAEFWPKFTSSGAYTFSRSWDGKESSKGWNKRIGASVDAQWELDLFGKVRRSQERAEAEEEQLAYSLQDVRVSLAAEIASAYVDARRYAAQIDIAEANLALQERNLGRVRKRCESGDAPRYDLYSAEAQVSRTRASLPVLYQSLNQTQLLLDRLCGLTPYATRDRLMEALDTMELPTDVPRIPQNDLLRRRADVRMAEAAIHAQTAAVGVAEAALYPSFSLSGSLGLSSPDLAPWSSYTRTLSLGPSFSWNIFAFGYWQKQVESAKATLLATVADYRDTVLKAYQEAETAWTAYRHEAARAQDLQRTEQACRQALDVADKLYELGEKDIEDVLSQQSALLTAQEALVSHRADLFADMITLYKALGGGWADSEQAPDADAS